MEKQEQTVKQITLTFEKSTEGDFSVKIPLGIGGMKYQKIKEKYQSVFDKIKRELKPDEEKVLTFEMSLSTGEYFLI